MSSEKHRRYNQSEKGRARNARYDASEKGEARFARCRDKKVEQTIRKYTPGTPEYEEMFRAAVTRGFPDV
jgi:hypothetical protein